MWLNIVQYFDGYRFQMRLLIGDTKGFTQGGDQAVGRLFSARYVTYICLRLDVM